jgi:hypothetical protein
MTKQFRDFESAREFAQKLGLKNRIEWRKYCMSSEKQNDIPANPDTTYKNKGWSGYGDWLGTGRRRTTQKSSEYRSFKEAREFVRNLGLKSLNEWQEYCTSGNKPDDIRIQPNLYNEFIGYGDFLGTGNTRNIKFRSYKEAREFAIALNIKNSKEWRRYAKSGDKPNDIPANPESSYKKIKEWKGWGDFLGTGRTGSSVKGKYLHFKEAKEFVQKLGLKNQKEWNEYCKSGNKPDDIPASPYQIFDNKGWSGYGDWLGTGRRRTHTSSEYRSFKEAREFVRSLGFKHWDDWFEYCTSGNKPDDIPAKPWQVYKEWKKE